MNPGIQMNNPPEGKLELYSHNQGRIGVMVEILVGTEVASHPEAFRYFAHEIALQITSMAPSYIRDEDIPQEILAGEAQAAAVKARGAGKPEKVIEQIVSGVLEKYKNRHVLLRQAYIRDETISVADLLQQASNQIGEKIVIRRFLRWEICPDSDLE